LSLKYWDKMYFFNSHKKLTERVSNGNLELALIGKFIDWFALGSIFSIQLVQYGYFFLLISMVILTNYCSRIFTFWMQGKKVYYRHHFFGLLGLFLLVLFTGIQTPQLPFKKYVFLLGLLFLIPAIIDLFKKQKKKK